MPVSPVKLLLVDDHRVVRLGLRALFETVPQFVVVGEAGTVAEALVAARQGQPDVVVMDVRLPDGSGVEACREIRSERPRTRVLMLTSYADEDAVVASIMAGAAGYLLKQSDPDRLIEAVEIVARGGSLLDPAVTQTVLQWIQRLGTRAIEDPLLALSDQERRILPLLAEGKTNREIAAELYLSEHTVKTYVSNILQKLHLSRRAEAAAFIARRRGLPAS
ncbi:MAG TPA: response regulator transcription factor [Chloroflexota bacterium]|nr:response regulator transcription factor [Chloroflexota bacterium]